MIKTFMLMSLIAVISLGVLIPVMSVITSPGRVITKTFETNNVIDNYEMFFDLNAGYQRRIGDIQGHKQLLESNPSEAEKTNLTIELVGMEQTCRDLVARYNAASQKQNRELFKAKNLPTELDMSTCN